MEEIRDSRFDLMSFDDTLFNEPESFTVSLNSIESDNVFGIANILRYFMSLSNSSESISIINNQDSIPLVNELSTVSITHSLDSGSISINTKSISLNRGNEE